MRDDEVKAVDPHAPVHGATVGPWLILERLGSGSFGVVYRAQRAGHPERGSFALKLARAPRDPRFEREAELLRRCPHPSIPRYEDEGLWTAPNGTRYPYLVMAWVEGLPLYDWFHAQPRTSREVLTVLQQVASALAAAHARGAVHRDVKGDNIRVTATGRAVLLDWGSGWFSGARPLTDTTAPPGTSAYRPPEQRLFMWTFRKDLEARWQAQPTDDLYSLGVAIYRLLTGVYLPPLTEGGEPVERKVLRPSAWATVCLELETLTLRLLSEERAQRGTAEQLARDAQVFAETAGPEADRPIHPTASAAPTDSGAPSSDGRQDEEVLSDTEPGRPPSATPTCRERTGRPPAILAWLSWASAAMAGGLLVAAVDLHWPHPPEPGEPWLVEQPGPEKADAGVADEALLAVEEVPRATAPTYALGLPMPKTPFLGQRKTPCGSELQRAINGGCWAGPIGSKRPPCGKDGFDHNDGCYLPIFDAPRQPTSKDP
jgi:serine/threonine protein kinase